MANFMADVDLFYLVILMFYSGPEKLIKSLCFLGTKFVLAELSISSYSGILGDLD